MKKMLDGRIFPAKFLIDWNDKNIRLDKKSVLYDKRVEHKFKE